MDGRADESDGAMGVQVDVDVDELEQVGRTENWEM